MGGRITEVFCERRTYDKQYHTHSHPYAQLILPIEGTLHYRTPIHDLSLDSRHLFFLPPNFDHTFCATDRNEFLVSDIPLFVLPDIGSADIEQHLPLAGWLILLYLGLFPTAASYALLGAGLKKATATSSSIVVLVEPLVATLLAVGFVGERLTVAGWVGAALLLASLVVLTVSAKRISQPAEKLCK
ncbi:EamA-like transporter family protein [Desulfotomaculum arcticum]|uniref:EamA-like transporter family protein n=1 Tax=Desulfotruncus arcticus DSM 17038 TaxID=1121424 RepID=A0A1I2R6A9_9FIRM|nr:EamA-like transporter family protein [Desulfotomaculum arcticum] [Desulfotruncus arcticus DSM 17038]